MSTQIYNQTLAAIENRLGIRGNARSGSISHFDVDGVTCALGYVPADSNIVLACDFGEPIAEFRAEALAKILELNLDLIGAGSTRFCCIPGSNRVAVVTAFQIAPGLAPDICDTMIDLANYAKDWRVANFLREPSNAHDSGKPDLPRTDAPRRAFPDSPRYQTAL